MTALARCPQAQHCKATGFRPPSPSRTHNDHARYVDVAHPPFLLSGPCPRSSTLCIADCRPYQACILQYFLAHNVVQEQLSPRAGLAESTIARARKSSVEIAPFAARRPQTPCLPLQCSRVALHNNISNNNVTPQSRLPRVRPSLGGTDEAAQMLPTRRQDPRRPPHLREHTTK